VGVRCCWRRGRASSRKRGRTLALALALALATFPHRVCVCSGREVVQLLARAVNQKPIYQ
jgi:hypothetical protein